MGSQPAPETAKVCCLVTVHGVGFMQPPQGTTPGYADGLHDHLAADLGGLLSGDPARGGLSKPIYVSSDWPPEQPVPLAGLERLGTIDPAAPCSVQVGGGDPVQDLVTGGSRIAHVALVYTGLQERGPDPEATLQMASLALSQLTQYVALGGLAGTLMDDLKAFLLRSSGRTSSSPSLRVRTDATSTDGGPKPPSDPGAAPSIIRQVEDDIAGYLSRNDARERVRDFVEGALSRLAMRDDVGSIVVNAHSQGTVVAYDALRRLAQASTKLAALVTAGSPLRKYVTLFSWGAEIGQLANARRWMNFWDPADPVADPLRPPDTWRRGTPMPATGPDSLMQATDARTGALSPYPVEDLPVDNVSNTDDAGFAVHNYWDNTPQFVGPLAAALRAASR